MISKQYNIKEEVHKTQINTHTHTHTYSHAHEHTITAQIHTHIWIIHIFTYTDTHRQMFRYILTLFMPIQNCVFSVTYTKFLKNKYKNLPCQQWDTYFSL